MPDAHKLEDQAALYVLGRLTPAERSEFEASLAGSADLRALVRDLEQGAVVLAMAMPQRPPPQYLGQRIEEAVAEEARRRIVAASFWAGWWRSGWAAAAACLLGWLLYALWINYSNVQGGLPSQVATHDRSQPEMTLTDSARMDTGTPTPPVPGTTNASARSLQMASTIAAQTKEIGALHGQITQLQRQVGLLSQVLTQQQALLSDPGRLKFLQLVRTSANGASATTGTFSPDLQRALLLAMARESGWRSAGSNSSNANQAEIDFVDLHPGANESANPGTLQSQVERSDTSGSSTLDSGSVTGIPAVVRADWAYLAFDASVVPNGSSLTFFSGTSSQPLGTVVLGTNRLVVAIPLGNMTADGLSLTVTAVSPAGAFSTFVPSLTPVSPPP